MNRSWSRPFAPTKVNPRECWPWAASRALTTPIMGAPCNGSWCGTSSLLSDKGRRGDEPQFADRTRPDRGHAGVRAGIALAELVVSHFHHFAPARVPDRARAAALLAAPPASRGGGRAALRARVHPLPRLHARGAAARIAAGARDSLSVRRLRDDAAAGLERDAQLPSQ